jgi:hypothetical protein
MRRPERGNELTGTAFIAGLGKQGVAIAYGLHKLGFDIEGVELGVEGANRAEEFAENMKKVLPEVAHSI